MTFATQTPATKPGLLLMLFLILGIFSQSLYADGATHWQQIAGQINASITQAEKLYAQGKFKEARSAVGQAYFAQFEDSKMEAALRTELGASHTWKVEKSFGRLRKAIKQSAPMTEISSLAAEIRTAIDNDAKQLDQAGISPQVFEVNQ